MDLKSVREEAQKRCWRQHFDTSRRQLDSQGKSIQANAYLGDSAHVGKCELKVGLDRLSTHLKQLYRWI